MKPIAALALFSFISPSASADVNMLDASFRQTFIDAKIAGLNIERRYDSRSNFIGLFGFGWCSTFDAHLEDAQVIECGKPSKTKARYNSNGTYTQTLASGLTRTFDADTGSLIALQALKSPPVGIDGGSRSRLPRAAALGEGLKMRPAPEQKISLEFDTLHEHLTALVLPDQTRLTFIYSAQRDLLEARNAWKNTYRFEYDKLHNLVRVNFPDTTTEQLEYDTDRDRLTKYQGRDGCTETYEHTTSVTQKERSQISIAKLNCQGQAKREVVFRFGFIRKGSAWLLNSFERGQK